MVDQRIGTEDFETTNCMWQKYNGSLLLYIKAQYTRNSEFYIFFTYSTDVNDTLLVSITLQFYTIKSSPVNSHSYLLTLLMHVTLLYLNCCINATLYIYRVTVINPSSSGFINAVDICSRNKTWGALLLLFNTSFLLDYSPQECPQIIHILLDYWSE